MVKNKLQNQGIRKLILVLVFTMLILPQIAQATTPWWNESFNFRMPINLTWTDANIEQITVQLTLDTSNTGPVFDFNTHRDSVRFVHYNTSTTSQTLLNHTALTWDTGNNNASIQLLIPELIQNSNNTIYLYFNSPSAPNIENYCDTYIYCDQFEDNSIDSRLQITDQDTVAGTIFDESTGVFNLTAGGNDIWTGSDQYGAAFINSVNGDVDVQLKVTSQTNPNTWAKAGIAFKNDMTSAGSSTGYGAIVATPGNGYSFQRDTNNNGYLDASTTASSVSYPGYVRMIKVGTSLTGYYSNTGPTAWTTIGTQTITTINTQSDIGMIVTSHSGATLSKVEFDDFIIKRYTTSTPTITTGTEQQLACM